MEYEKIRNLLEQKISHKGDQPTSNFISVMDDAIALDEIALIEEKDTGREPTSKSVERTKALASKKFTNRH